MHTIQLDCNLPALRFAVELCEITPNFKAGVILDPDCKYLEPRMLEIVHDLLNYVDVYKYERCSHLKDDIYCIVFKNGSTIHITTPLDSSRAYRWMMIILDTTLDNKTRLHATRRWLTG